MMTSATANGRAWVAECKWKSAKEAFWFGTVYVRIGAPHHEIEAAVFAALAFILPPLIDRPDIIELKPGSLVFLPEAE